MVCFVGWIDACYIINMFNCDYIIVIYAREREDYRSVQKRLRQEALLRSAAHPPRMQSEIIRYNRGWTSSRVTSLVIKGTEPRDLSTSGFFMSQFPPSPWVSQTGGAPWLCEYLREFSNKIRNDQNVIFRDSGEDDSWKNLKQKISWLCPFRQFSVSCKTGAKIYFSYKILCTFPPVLMVFFSLF